MNNILYVQNIFQKRREANSREKKIEKLNRMNDIFTEVSSYVQNLQLINGRLIVELNKLADNISKLEEELLNGE